MKEKERIVDLVAVGFEVDVKPELIVELPDDGTHHMGLSYKVYAARCGEFVITGHVFDDGNISITMN